MAAKKLAYVTGTSRWGYQLKVDPELERLAAMVEAAPQLAQALADLAAASWLEPDPSDSDELAQAKRAALAALAAATGEK
ncbi:TPA: hypothetical protein ACKPXV_001405 [Pseudomonas aeruginosa]